MSHDAYLRAAKALAAPRDAEYRAFGEATRRLMAVEGTMRGDLKALIEAIHLNRQLWGALADDCADGRNLLPAQTRAQIVSLARWVAAYSSDVMRKDESVGPLIDVNRIIMEGLAARRPVA